MSQPPEGHRFSQVYLDRGDPKRDSERLRTRLAGHFGTITSESLRADIAGLIQAELGIRVPSTGYGYDWDHFIGKCELRDLLDLVTLVWRAAMKSSLSYVARDWLAFTRRAIAEENFAYTVDDKCGVHFAVDQQFARSTVATVRKLGTSRLSAVRHAFDSVGDALDQPTPDTLKAVRSVFDAQETLFKLMFPNSSRLGPTEIKQCLHPRLPNHFSGAGLEASKKVAAAWSEWVVALQQYRHADRTEIPNPPPIDLAVALVSLGTDFLRWLLDLDVMLSGTTPADGQ